MCLNLFNFVVQRHFLTSFSVILPLFCVLEVDSKHVIFQGFKFLVSFRGQNVVDEKFTGIF